MAELSLQLCEDESNWRVETFSNLPLNSPMLLSFEFIHSDSATETWLKKLFKAVYAELLRLGGTPSQPIQNESWKNLKGRTMIALVVPDDLKSYKMPRRYAEILNGNEEAGAILPILPCTASPSQWLWSELAELNCDFIESWKDDPAPIADHVLTAAEVAVSDRRAFISYRRTESQAMANQLHMALIRANFDVFLDIVDVPLTSHFQNVLLEELAQKAMVVVIDSPTYQKSKWCMEEMHFAEKHRLGVFVLRGCHTKRPFSRLPMALDPPTFELDQQDYRKFPDNAADRELSGGVLEQVMLQIKLEHQRAFVARKREALANLLSCLDDAGLDYQEGEDGLVHVEDVKGKQVAFSIRLTPRRPQLNDVHACSVRRGHGAQGVVVGLMEGLQKNNQTLFNWLSNSTKIRFFDLIQIPDVAEAIKKGNL